MSPRTARRRALVAGALVAALLPAIGPAAPAGAAPGCTTDVDRSALALGGCDDDTPPETQILSVSPRPTAGGYVSSGSLTFTFRGVHPDGDTDPIGFRCRLVGLESAPSACSSPATYRGLADDKLDGYEFQVTAVDTTDAAHAWVDWLALPIRTEADPSDADPTPATQAVRVDTLLPNTYIFGDLYGGLHYDVRPSLPMALTPDLPVFVDSSESAERGGVGYACTVGARAVPCRQDRTVLRHLTPGTKVLKVAAVDPAGNRDPSPASLRFSVPRDLTAPARGPWRTRKGAGHFGRDALETSKVGARVVVRPAGAVREVILLAPAGPRLGVVTVRIGRGFSKRIRLSAPRNEALKVYVVRRVEDGPLRGPITIEVTSLGAGKVARIDALLAH
ncbi:hypothetical protein [Nocardioides sp. cx-173]|uniref:hypothetical protein n=1 Tax=Nocardioides sp. cx-173 TaxID=2898796 RepID=UPI001E49749F|nr:hypothetical protein [Nocardioides sp. cx-173]MCD4523781.1 hypothetical protein [Nocardioides sp. cx-173]UGB41895.1 hypothetical protein LQ940_21435 [Nocardioides sp. cx-173]